MRNVLLVAVVSLMGTNLVAQNPTRPPSAVREVSLEEAITLADRSSEMLDIARSAVTRARGQQLVARSQFLPQVDAVVAYQRTLASQFEGFSFGGPDTNSFRALCTPNVSPTATPAERQAALDQARTCPAAGGGADFSSVGFGAENQWTAGLQIFQPIFTGGRNVGTRAAASANRRAADIELTAQRAQLILDVTQAYYNAVLAARFVDIAQITLTMNDEVLRQTTRARQVGSAAEFDLLRAQVARDNQVPVVLRQRSTATVAILRLKQLLELPLGDSIQLTTPIDDAPVPTVAGVSEERVASPDTSVASRSTVREAGENVKAQEGLLKVARSERYPTISLVSGYQRLFFPLSSFPVLTDFRENWTIGINAGVSLLSGGRVSGQILTAEANLREARARAEAGASSSRRSTRASRSVSSSRRRRRGTRARARRNRRAARTRSTRSAFAKASRTQTDLTQSRLLLAAGDGESRRRRPRSRGRARAPRAAEGSAGARSRRRCRRGLRYRRGRPGRRARCIISAAATVTTTTNHDRERKLDFREHTAMMARIRTTSTTVALLALVFAGVGRVQERRCRPRTRRAVNPVLVGPENVVVVAAQQIRTGPTLSGAIQAENASDGARRSDRRRDADVSRNRASAWGGAAAGAPRRHGDPRSRRFRARAAVTTAQNAYEIARRELERAEALEKAGAIADA